MIKVLPGFRGLIKFLEKQGGINSGGFDGKSTYAYYYIDNITNIIQSIYEYDITRNPEKYKICSIKNYKKKEKQILINYQEI